MGLIANTISDSLNRIKNANRVGHQYVFVKKSKFLANILKVMKENGYIGDFVEDSEKRYFYKVELKYYNGKPVIKDIKILSNPSRRLYLGYRDMKPYKNNLGITIVSTPRGVMTSVEAKNLKVGGMLICSIW
ncbi:MAG: 30S ribosomal protein S8 [Brevinematales bacterium]|nr:30S ribosomal protein S8 [Brevinematales bacterium]